MLTEEAIAPEPVQDEEEDGPESEQRLVKRLLADIAADKEYHKAAFKRMRDDMFVARFGYRPGDGWGEEKYSANITGQQIESKTSTLYAKNPKVKASRRKTLDFAVWDETPESLMLAQQTLQMMAAAQPTPAIDTMTGAAVALPPPPVPGAEQAMALMADFQQGMERRTLAARLGASMEIVFEYQISQQQPVDFTTSMEKLVRRIQTTGVGYVDIQFERAYGADPLISARLMDAQSRLRHMQQLIEGLAEGEVEEESAEIAELEAMIASMQATPEVITREGLIFDFPGACRVIPDRLCRDLVGWVGARRVTIEMLYTTKQVEESFGVDLKTQYKAYKPTGEADDSGDTSLEAEDGSGKRNGLCCVFKTYDRVSGQVYFTCDGYKRLLRPAAPPDVWIENFFPIHAFTFNEVEDEKEIFPPSDVWKLRHVQAEYNRSRDGKREHRKAARPRWVSPKGVLDDESTAALSGAEAFTVTEMNLPPEGKVGDALQEMPVPGVDPNLYDVGEVFADMQLIAGTQQAQLGGLSKATATEVAASADTSSLLAGSDSSKLDRALSRLAKDCGKILLKEVSPETAQRVAGPGVVWPGGAWPAMSLQEIADEMVLDVEAGSTGKPNQAQELANLERVGPLLLQIPGINPVFLAKEMLRRLDDRMDLTEALVPGLPAIVAQNRMAQPMTDPGNDPGDQGAEGADKNSTPETSSGSDAPMGNNQPAGQNVENGVA